jgi:hypothetical protein
MARVSFAAITLNLQSILHQIFAKQPAYQDNSQGLIKETQ